jgi:hypothetical protein
MDEDHPSQENEFSEQETIPQEAEIHENRTEGESAQETFALDEPIASPDPVTQSVDQEPALVSETIETSNIVPEVSIIAEPSQPLPEPTQHRSSIVEPSRLSVVESRRSEVRNSRAQEVDRLEEELHARHRAKRASILDPDLIDFPEQVLLEVEKITNQKEKTVRDIDFQNFKL